MAPLFCGLSAFQEIRDDVFTQLIIYNKKNVGVYSSPRRLHAIFQPPCDIIGVLWKG